jgi:hypothetical protein
MVMNAFFEDTADTNSVRLYHTSETGPIAITDAEVSLYKNGTLCEQSHYSQGRYPFVTRYQASDRLQLVAQSGKETVQAEVYVLPSVKILNVDTLQVMTTDNDDDSFLRPYIRVRLRMRDLPGQENYYRIVAERIDSTFCNDWTKIEVYHSFDFTIHSDDAVLSDGWGDNDASSLVTGASYNYYGIFRNNLFRNSEAELTFYLSQSHYFRGFDIDEIRSYYRFKILNISSEEFEYLRLVNIYRSDIYIDGLYDPLIFPTNVKGGTGLFAASASEPLWLYYGTFTYDDLYIDYRY